MGLAGTDFEQHRHFQAAAERYRRDLMHRMNRAMAERGRTADGSAPNADATLWASVPPFAYEMPGAGWVLARQGANVAVLAGWTLVAVLAAAWAARRLPVDGGGAA
jgi:ABC-2 type transport system permease protein